MAATSTKPLSIFLSAQLLYDRQRLEARLHGYFCQSPVPGSEGYHLFRLRLDCQARSQMDGVIGSESVIFCERPASRTSALPTAIKKNCGQSRCRSRRARRCSAGFNAPSRYRRASAARSSTYAISDVETTSASPTPRRACSVPSSSTYSFTRALVSRYRINADPR